MQIDYCEFPDDALYDLANNVWIRLDEKKSAKLWTKIRIGQRVATCEGAKRRLDSVALSELLVNVRNCLSRWMKRKRITITTRSGEKTCAVN